MIDPNEDFCRKLCEEVGLVSRPYAEEYHGVEEWAVESAMSAISKAIHIVMEKAARTADDTGCDGRCGGAIRSLQLSAEDVRTEGK